MKDVGVVFMKADLTAENAPGWTSPKSRTPGCTEQPTKFGKYLLLDRIAVGGMAEVFLAKAYGAHGFEKTIAIKRIHAGTYGVCEIKQEPIAKERLLAVPFTRYSAEAQKDLERNRHRSRTQAGIFGELGEETGGKIPSDDGGDD